jgi:hypothetical protein
MTVNGLISVLKKFPGDLPVAIEDHEGYYVPPESSKAVLITRDRDHPDALYIGRSYKIPEGTAGFDPEKKEYTIVVIHQ